MLVLYGIIFIVIVVAIWCGGCFVSFVMSRLKKEGKEGAKERINDLSRKLEISDNELEKESLKDQIKKAVEDRELTEIFDHEKRISMIFGMLERSIYIGALILEYPQFIAVWLAFKVIGNWGDRRSGRIDRFIVGNALNLIISVLAALLIINLVDVSACCSL